MRQSRINIKHDVREHMVALLNAQLADAIDLRTSKRISNQVDSGGVLHGAFRERAPCDLLRS